MVFLNKIISSVEGTPKTGYVQTCFVPVTLTRWP